MRSKKARNVIFVSLLLAIFSIVSLAFSCTPKVLAASSPDEFNASQKQPNIVLIVADDLGYGDVGYLGSEIPTPTLDSLAFNGVQLNRYYTFPMCTPSRAALLTGQYPTKIGMHGSVIGPYSSKGLPTELKTLPDYLSELGYAKRGSVGKWHLGHSNRKYHPNNRGFNYFCGHYGGLIDFFTYKNKGIRDWHENYESVEEEDYATDVISEKAVNFIDGVEGDDPFFLYVAYNAPHTPLQAKKEDLIACGYDEEKGSYLKDPAYPKKGRGNTKRQTYTAMVKSMDAGIATIIDKLKSEGKSDNTVILFVSDNGGNLNEGADNGILKKGKSSFYEGGIRVPAFINSPMLHKKKIKSESIIDFPVSYVDILPTILGFTDMDPFLNSDLDGDDIFLLSEFRSVRRSILINKFCFVQGPWKLLKGALYNVQNDPSENRDVKNEYPNLYEDLSKQRDDLVRLKAIDPLPDGKHKLLPNWEMPK